jgi:hypothetical protein
MPTKPLEHFDFARTFEAATFTVEIEDYGDDQRYASLVSGWTAMLNRVADLMFKPGRNHNDLDGWRASCHGEILDHIGQPDQWEWATTSDMWPYKVSWTVGHGQPYQRTVTILRLFQDENERAVFQKNFPGGRRPGEADDEVEPKPENAVSSGKEFRVASLEAIVALREVLEQWDWQKRDKTPEAVARVTDALEVALIGYLLRLPPKANCSPEEARAAFAQNTPNVIATPTVLNGLPPEVAPLMIVRSLLRDYRAPLYADCTSIQYFMSQYDHTGLFAHSKVEIIEQALR